MLVGLEKRILKVLVLTFRRHSSKKQRKMWRLLLFVTMIAVSIVFFFLQQEAFYNLLKNGCIRFFSAANPFFSPSQQICAQLFNFPNMANEEGKRKRDSLTEASVEGDLSFAHTELPSNLTVAGDIPLPTLSTEERSVS